MGAIEYFLNVRFVWNKQVDINSKKYAQHKVTKPRHSDPTGVSVFKKHYKNLELQFFKAD
jgi:hypothetical protein